MFDAALYGHAYFNTLLALTLLTCIIYLQAQPNAAITLGYNSGMLWIAAITLTVFIGTRPVSGFYFSDMGTYAARFESIVSGRSAVWEDVGFNILTEFCASAMNTKSYFLVCAALYFIPIAIATRRKHPRWAFAAFLAFLGALSFYPYAVNGIRNGIATSLLLAAYAFYDRKLVMLLLMVLAVSMHKSVVLPAIAFIAAGFFANPLAYGAIWALALGAVAALGEGLSNRMSMLISLGGTDERLSTYVANAGLSGDKGGFRGDFILYSIVPIMLSYALASPALRKDLFYRRLVCTYLFTNAAWLCLMYAAFSNRFAYLSWFMMPWIAIYPFLPQENKFAVEPTKQMRIGTLALGLIAHFAFTYIMMIFVYGTRA